jgi:hypothetical protein
MDAPGICDLFGVPALAGKDARMEKGDKIYRASQFIPALPEPAKAGTPSGLMFEAGTGLIAHLHAYWPLVRAGFGEGAGAPAMAGMPDFLVVGRKRFGGQSRDEHLFRPEIFALISRLHNQAVSCISVR